MKRLGILGGMSWESTALYYRELNNCIKAALGGLHSADLIVRSVDFAVIEKMQAEGRWDAAGEYLANEARALETAGAEGIVLATNTMHKIAKTICAQLNVPFLHLADCTAQALIQRGVTKVGLLGTAFTMEQAFYKERLESYGLVVTIPSAEERAEVHRIIYDELCLGVVSADSQARYIAITEALAAEGAQCVILGCTEIGLLLSEKVTEVPLIDTTSVHVQAAADWMLKR